MPVQRLPIFFCLLLLLLFPPHPAMSSSQWKKLRILSFFETFNDESSQHIDITAALIAQNHVNQYIRENFYTNYKIEIVPYDTECDQGVATYKLLDAIHESRVREDSHVFSLFGSSCSNVTRQLALISSQWNFTMITHASLATDLNNRIEYDNLYRLIPTTTSFRYTLKTFLQHHHWKNVALLSEDDEIYNNLRNRYYNILLRSNFSINESLSLNEHNTWSELKGLKENGQRVFVLFSSIPFLLQMLCTAIENNLTTRRYVWIIMATWPNIKQKPTISTCDELFHHYNWILTGRCTQQQISRALVGHFCIQTSTLFYTHEYSRISSDSLLEEIHSIIPDSSPYHNITLRSFVDYKAIVAYDSVWLLALTLIKVIFSEDDQLLSAYEEREMFPQKRIPPMNILKKRMDLIISTLDYTGLTGPLKFVDGYNGDRIGESEVLQFLPKHMNKFKLIRKAEEEYNKNKNSQRKVFDNTIIKLRKARVALFRLNIGGVNHRKRRQREFNESQFMKLVNYKNNNTSDSFIGTLNFNGNFCEKIWWPANKPPADSNLIIDVDITIEQSVTKFVCVLCVIGTIMAIFCSYFNIRYRNNGIVKVSSPKLNAFTALGCMNVFIACGISAVDEGWGATNKILSILCVVKNMLYATGFTMAFGSIFVKTFRIHFIMTRTTAGDMAKSKLLKDHYLILFVTLQLLFDIVFIAVWHALHPLNRIRKFLTIRTFHNDLDKVVRQWIWKCNSAHILRWSAVIYTHKGLVLLFGLYMAWETRHVNVQVLNDSKHIALTVYLVVVASAFVVVASYIPHHGNVTLYFAMVFIPVILVTMAIMGILFIPKMYGVYLSKDRRRLSNVVTLSKDLQTSHFMAEGPAVRRLITERPIEKLRLNEKQNSALKDILEELKIKVVKTKEYLEFWDNTALNSTKRRPNTLIRLLQILDTIGNKKEISGQTNFPMYINNSCFRRKKKKTGSALKRNGNEMQNLHVTFNDNRRKSLSLIKRRQVLSSYLDNMLTSSSEDSEGENGDYKKGDTNDKLQAYYNYYMVPKYIDRKVLYEFVEQYDTKMASDVYELQRIKISRNQYLSKENSKPKATRNLWKYLMTKSTMTKTYLNGRRESSLSRIWNHSKSNTSFNSKKKLNSSQLSLVDSCASSSENIIKADVAQASLQLPKTIKQKNHTPNISSAVLALVRMNRAKKDLNDLSEPPVELSSDSNNNPPTGHMDVKSIFFNVLQRAKGKQKPKRAIACDNIALLSGGTYDFFTRYDMEFAIDQITPTDQFGSVTNVVEVKSGENKNFELTSKIKSIKDLVNVVSPLPSSSSSSSSSSSTSTLTNNKLKMVNSKITTSSSTMTTTTTTVINELNSSSLISPSIDTTLPRTNKLSAEMKLNQNNIITTSHTRVSPSIKIRKATECCLKTQPKMVNPLISRVLEMQRNAEEKNEGISAGECSSLEIEKSKTNIPSKSKNSSHLKPSLSSSSFQRFSGNTSRRASKLAGKMGKSKWLKLIRDMHESENKNLSVDRESNASSSFTSRLRRHRRESNIGNRSNEGVGIKRSLWKTLRSSKHTTSSTSTDMNIPQFVHVQLFPKDGCSQHYTFSIDDIDWIKESNIISKLDNTKLLTDLSITHANNATEKRKLMQKNRLKNFVSFADEQVKESRSIKSRCNSMDNSSIKFLKEKTTNTEDDEFADRNLHTSISLVSLSTMKSLFCASHYTNLHRHPKKNNFYYSAASLWELPFMTNYFCPTCIDALFVDNFTMADVERRPSKFSISSKTIQREFQNSLHSFTFTDRSKISSTFDDLSDESIHSSLHISEKEPSLPLITSCKSDDDDTFVEHIIRNEKRIPISSAMKYQSPSTKNIIKEISLQRSQFFDMGNSGNSSSNNQSISLANQRYFTPQANRVNINRMLMKRIRLAFYISDSAERLNFFSSSDNEQFSSNQLKQTQPNMIQYFSNVNLFNRNTYRSPTKKRENSSLVTIFTSDE
ncbi:hypothetical protein SNEBB_011079 [Seison nebaliae]|nr:hypothetical protein SNEBB_011079 [Seison nebaliae]